MKKIVYIEKDELNAIAICRDNYKGVVVQVIRFVDQLIPNEKKELVNFRNQQVINSEIVHFKPNSSIKDEVAKAIVKCKEFLSNIKLQDKEIEGVMNDYYSQNKGLNSSE